MAGTVPLLRLSKFVHFVPCGNGFVALFNALNLAVAAVTQPVADRLARREALSDETLRLLDQQSEALLPELRRQHILVSSEYDEQQDLDAARSHLSHAPIGILYLLMTEACNLRCHYCYIEAALPPKFQSSKMTAETARSGIDLFARTLRDSRSTADEPQIIFYGGEPFLNWPTMRTSLEYIDQQIGSAALPRPTAVTVNSNGTLLTDEIAQELGRFPFVTVSVSIDGPQELHDELRPDTHRKGTYERAEAGIRRLKAAGVNVGLCCTLTSRNLPRAEEILLWLRQAYGVSAIGFNLLIAQKDEGSPGGYADRVADAIIRSFQVARREGMYEDRMMRKVKSFLQGKINYYDCGGCGGQLVVAPDGQVGVCQAYCGTKQYFTHVDAAFDPYQHVYWREWRQRSPISLKQCGDCIALGNCGGGCAYAAEAMHGSIRALDDNFCTFSKRAAEFLVKDLVSSMCRQAPVGAVGR